MAQALDLNRGVMTKFHPSGIKVSMYIDDPGTYYADNGQALAEELAAQAGFDIDRNKREKVKLLKMKAYKEQLEREMQSEEDALADAMSKGDNHDVRHIGGGQYAIFDKATGARITRVAMSKADVELLIGPLKEAPAGDEHSPTPDDSSEADD